MNISMRYFSILVVVSFSIFSFKYGFWSEASEASDSKIDTRAVSVLKGTITHVRDGDTFEINGIPVRISALDCAENSTPEGKKITRFAKKFLGKQAVCELTGAKTYDRVVGYCSIEGKDFARTMMNETSCKLWAKYDVWDRY
jgi:endonuclease YncB( thermonuclease family)|tara:strand:+ start:600 stop:1025 length:426 start_codon:yes stop_codon:yes gene_type:complete